MRTPPNPNPLALRTGHNGLIFPDMSEHVSKGEASALAQRSGNLSINGGRQIFLPPPIIVCTNSGEGATTYNTVVQIPTPDSRCRVKVSILYVPLAGDAPDDITGFTNIWIAGCDFDQRGVGGGGGRAIPATNVEGTEAAPTAIPKSTGLLGYSREFVTAADCLQVTFSTASMGVGRGAWMLQCRLQPDAVTLEWKEWELIRALFNPLNLSNQGAV
jgi:hypothetical protein